MTTTYDDVNSAWGGVTVPPITQKESVPLFAKLIKKFGRHEDRGTMVVPYWARKGRRVWASPKPQDTTRASNGGLPGLGRMIHDASHVVFEWRHPTFLTHSHRHAELEREMIQFVVTKGWHLPKPKKPKPAKVVPTAADKLARILAAEKRWTTKLKRADTALKKLARQRRYYERAQAPRTLAAPAR